MAGLAAAAAVAVASLHKGQHAADYVRAAVLGALLVAWGDTTSFFAMLAIAVAAGSEVSFQLGSRTHAAFFVNVSAYVLVAFAAMAAFDNLFLLWCSAIAAVANIFWSAPAVADNKKKEE